MVNYKVFELLAFSKSAIILLYEVKLYCSLKRRVIIMKLQVYKQSLCTSCLFIDELVSFRIVDGLEVFVPGS